MLKFREWLIEAEDKEDDDPKHLQAMKDVLEIDYDALEGTSVPYTGTLGNKTYNMLPTIVDKFMPDAENPTQVQLKIDSSENPHLAQQVIWAKEQGDPKMAEADEGCFIITIKEFNDMFQTPWVGALQGGMGGGMGGLGGMI
jgi:hypothetical protein